MIDRADDGFRLLTDAEREVLETLLEPEFPGRDELRLQLAQAAGRPLDHDGCVEFAPGNGPRAAVRFKIASAGEYVDEQGRNVHVQLHVGDGRLTSLEIHMADGSIPTGFPPARELRLYAPDSPEAGTWNRSPNYR
ncbi:MAG TPA: hypothetical protein VHO67_23000 [Polyangia bacterium]|nr:hypothetical protein [Polyangia bacterium]